MNHEFTPDDNVILDSRQTRRLQTPNERDKLTDVNAHDTITTQIQLVICGAPKKTESIELLRDNISIFGLTLCERLDSPRPRLDLLET